VNSRQEIYLVLRGGLGNQLFQVAAALKLAEGGKILVNKSLGSVRSTHGLADILYFRLPENVTFVDFRFNKFLEKLLSVNLRLGLKSRGRNLNKPILRTIEIFSDLCFTIYFKKPTHLINAKNIGDFSVKLRNHRNLLNGYFQSEEWANASTTQSKFLSPTLAATSQRLADLLIDVQRDRPIILHIRRGDYSFEPDIGILDYRYFRNAIEKLETLTPVRNIWIFSDEPNSVLIDSFVPSNFNGRIIEEPNLSPAETLELMRHGTAYVISNSTFSWWAAFLSYHRNAITIMPVPWFKNQESPLGIKPTDWTEIENPF
jgi:hypothetical protein